MSQNMTKKMIGLAISAMDSETMIELYRGIRDEAEKNDYSTQGFVIYPSMASSKLYNDGEYFIFETINFAKYDAVIVILNSISDYAIKEKIKKQLVDATIPIIAIDCEIAHSYLIKNDNYDSVKSLLNHLIHNLGRKKINYISGPLDNEDSVERLKAYEDGMKENHLSTEGRIYNGCFYLQDGVNAIDYFEKNSIGHDYDAIMCANDMSAISVFAELKKRHISIPEEVVITGYDGIKETDFIPILTISRHDYSTGKHIVDMLKKLWNNETLPQVTKIPAHIQYDNLSKVSLSDLKSSNIFNSFVEGNIVHANIRSFVEDSTKCTTFLEYLDIVKNFILKLNPKTFQFVILHDFAEIFQIEDYQSVVMKNADGVSLTMYNVIIYENGTFSDIENQSDLSKIPPEFVELSELELWKWILANMPVRQLLNTPIHFLNNKFGFISFSNSNLPLLSTIYWDWIMTLNYTINNVYQNLMKKEIYMHDVLTEVYNRSGLDYYYSYFLDQSKKKHYDISIIFLDMNGLKPINDQLGHESGDLAIRIVADSLKRCCPSKMKIIRYGGDEFIVLGLGICESEIQTLVDKINSDIPKYGELMLLGFPISASIGYYIRPWDSEESMETCITNADSIMYENKKEFKKNHNS